MAGTLMDAWSAEQRCFTSGQGSMDIDGTHYDWEVENVDVGFRAHMPTTRRICTRVARDLSKSVDEAFVMNQGWAEGPMDHGDSLNTAMTVLQVGGQAQNPAYISLFPVGKGTVRYSTGEGIGRIRLDDELADVQMCTRRLFENGWLSTDMEIHDAGHSMGALAAFAVAREVMANNAQIASIMTLAGVTDQPLGLVRPKFLWAVRKHVIPAILGLVTKRGMNLDFEDYCRMMFGGDEDTGVAIPNYVRGFPADSGTRFLEATLLMRRRFDDVLAQLAEKGTPVAVVRHGLDRIIPDGMPPAHVEYMKGKGVNARLLELPSMRHSIPFSDMTPRQRDELAGVLSDVLRSR